MLIHFGYSMASVHFISPKHHIESSFEADGEENQSCLGITVLSSAYALPHGRPVFPRWVHKLAKEAQSLGLHFPC